MIRRASVLVVALLMAACGGGEDPAIDVPEGEQTDAAPEEPAEVGLGGDIAELAGAWAESSAKVSYDLISGTSPTQAMTLYWMPPTSWRMDIGGAAGSTIIISTKDGGFVCTEAAGASQCIKSPADVSAQAPVPFAGLFSSPEGLLDEIETQTGGAELERSSERIAGVDAECFAASAESATGAGTVEWCFSRDGILLRYSVAGASTAATGEFTMEATEVDTDVTRADFEPPYPVTDISGSSGGGEDDEDSITGNG